MNALTPTRATDPKLIEITVADLRPAVTAAASVVEKRNTIPIIGCLRITPKAGKLVIEGTNLDAWMRVECPAQCQPQPPIALPARVLRAALAGAESNDSVSIKSVGDVVTLTIGPVTMSLRQLCLAEDFPETPPSNDMTFCTVPEAVLVKLIDNTRWAISTDETRYYLNGIYLLERDGRLAGVSVDGRQMALYQTEAEYALPAKIFPRTSVAPLRQMLAPGGNHALRIGVAADRPLMRIEGDGWTLIAKCIDGTYPNFMGVMPDRSAMTGHVVINHALMRRIPKTGLGRHTSGAISLDLTNRVAQVNATDQGIVIETPIEAAGDFTIGFNEKYIREIVRLFGTVRIEVSASRNAALALTDDPCMTAVLMPMRVV